MAETVSDRLCHQTGEVYALFSSPRPAAPETLTATAAACWFTWCPVASGVLGGARRAQRRTALRDASTLTVPPRLRRAAKWPGDQPSRHGARPRAARGRAGQLNCARYELKSRALLSVTGDPFKRALHAPVRTAVAQHTGVAACSNVFEFWNVTARRAQVCPGYRDGA